MAGNVIKVSDKPVVTTLTGDEKILLITEDKAVVQFDSINKLTEVLGLKKEYTYKPKLQGNNGDYIQLRIKMIPPGCANTLKILLGTDPNNYHHVSSLYEIKVMPGLIYRPTPPVVSRQTAWSDRTDIFLSSVILGSSTGNPEYRLYLKLGSNTSPSSIYSIVSDFTLDIVNVGAEAPALATKATTTLNNTNMIFCGSNIIV